MDEKCTRIWQKLSLALKPEVSSDTFKRWFSSVELIQANEDALTFRVPNNIYQFWIESNYMSALQSAVVSALGEPRQIKFSTSGTDTPASQKASAPVSNGDSTPETTEETNRESKTNVSAVGLNPRNTFETFVVGPNNEIAHAASLAVAQSPARTYNPLFIYGGVGLGKTHLMQAIGQYIWAKKKSTKVMYLSSELFINEFIDAIQHNNLVKFRKRSVRPNCS